MTRTGRPLPLVVRAVLAVLRGIRNFLVFLVVLCVMALLAFVIGYAWTVQRSGEYVKVPLVIGLSIEQAYETLINAGLRIQSPVEGRYTEDLPEGYVVHQYPPAGAMTKKYRSVQLIKSAGTEYVVVPDVRTRDRQTAELRLRERGLVVGTVAFVPHPDMPAERVIAQDPPGRTRTHRSVSVNLLVSLGPPREPNPMPDLLGMRLSQAEVTLQREGVTIETITEQRDTNRPAGTIIATDPPPRSPLFSDAPVNIVLATSTVPIRPGVDQAVDGEWRVALFEYALPETYDGDPVEIKVFDEAGLRSIPAPRPAASERIELPIRVRGKAQVFVYVGGVLQYQGLLQGL